MSVKTYLSPYSPSNPSQTPLGYAPKQPQKGSQPKKPPYFELVSGKRVPLIQIPNPTLSASPKGIWYPAAFSNSAPHLEQRLGENHVNPTKPTQKPPTLLAISDQYVRDICNRNNVPKMYELLHEPDISPAQKQNVKDHLLCLQYPRLFKAINWIAMCFYRLGLLDADRRIDRYIKSGRLLMLAQMIIWPLSEDQLASIINFLDQCEPSDPGAEQSRNMFALFAIQLQNPGGIDPNDLINEIHEVCTTVESKKQLGNQITQALASALQTEDELDPAWVKFVNTHYDTVLNGIESKLNGETLTRLTPEQRQKYQAATS